MKPVSTKLLRELEDHLCAEGFSGDIPQNSGHKNWLVIKKLMKNHSFYTFGIKRVEEAIAKREVGAAAVRDIMIAASGITIERWRRHGPGHFSSRAVATRLVEAMAEIYWRAKAGETIVFATGHAGAMVGFLDGLASWAQDLGATIAAIDKAVEIKGEFKLDMIGRVLIASDGCSAQHTHDDSYMDKFLQSHKVDYVVADHGFTGAALNHGIPAIGFYDTDDPGMPLAEALELPVLAVPFNDNNYNANGTALASYLIERLMSHGQSKPRRPRTRAN